MLHLGDPHAFNRSSSIAYREVTCGMVVDLCQGDVEMLETCSDFVLYEDFHSGLVDNFLHALKPLTSGIDMQLFWQTKPKDRALQFQLFPDFFGGGGRRKSPHRSDSGDARQRGSSPLLSFLAQSP